MAEFDNDLRSTGVDPADFHRAAKEGVFAAILAGGE